MKMCSSQQDLTSDLNNINYYNGANVNCDFLYMDSEVVVVRNNSLYVYTSFEKEKNNVL